MNSSTNRIDWTKQRLGRLPRTVAIAYWGAITAIAMVSALLIWPEPYVFRMSHKDWYSGQDIDDGIWYPAETIGGKFVHLDDYCIGYKKLAAFKRKCILSVVFSGVIGAGVAHLLASLWTARDVSVLMAVISTPIIMIGLWIAWATLPEVVDPVYTSFPLRLPFWHWIHILIFVLSIAVATAIEICLLAVRWGIGRYALKAT